MEIRRILLPTDFSEVSSVALEYAIDMMRRYGAKLYIIHVIHDISKRIGGWYTPHPSVDEMSKDIESAAKKELERFGLEELRRQKDVERVVLKGTPQEEIIKFANKNKIDLDNWWKEEDGLITVQTEYIKLGLYLLKYVLLSDHPSLKVNEKIAEVQK